MSQFRAKKNISILVICAFFVLSCRPFYYSTAYKKINLDEKTIAVLPFDNESVDFDATPIFRHAIYNYLLSRRFKIIPLDQVDKILAGQGVDEGGKVWKFTPEELGELLGVDYLLYGVVTDFNTKYMVVYSSINVDGRFELYETKSGEKVWEGTSGSHSNNFTRIFFVGDLIELMITLDIKEFLTNNDFVKLFKKDHHEIISAQYLKKNVKYNRKSKSSTTVSVDPRTARMIMEGAGAGVRAIKLKMDSDEAWIAAAVIFLTWTLLYAIFDNYDNYVVELVVKGFKNFPG